MARIRSIHPGIWTDEAFVGVSPLARLLVIGIWTECDDHGVFEWKPVVLRMRLFPAESVDVSALLAELTAVDIIASYEVDGRRYGAVRNFGRFQSPKKPRAVHPLPDAWRSYVASPTGSPSVPTDGEDEANEPPEMGGGTPTHSPPVPHQFPTGSEPVPHQFPTGSEPVPHQFPTGSEPVPEKEESHRQMEREREKEEEKEKKEGSLRSPRARACAADPNFAEWYAEYPRKDAPDAALRAYRKAITSGATPADLLMGVRAYPFDRRDGGRFIPHPATWLNSGRWKSATEAPRLPLGPDPPRRRGRTDWMDDYGQPVALPDEPPIINATPLDDAA